MAKYYAFLAAELLFSHCPRIIGYFLAALVADIAFLLSPRLRSTVTDNIRHVLGPEADDAAVRSVARKVLRNTLKNYFDLIRSQHFKPEDIQRRITAYNDDRLVNAVVKGKGVVLVTAHFGSFDIALQLLAARPVQTTVLVEALEPERLLEHVVSLRKSKGLNVVPARSGALQVVLRALRNGEMVLFACDRDLTGDAPNAKFFGEETRVPDIAVRLALRTGAVIVPVFNLRRDHGRYDVYVEPPIEVGPNGNGAAEHYMAQVIHVMEKYIKSCPEQWVVLEPIWTGNSGQAAKQG